MATLADRIECLEPVILLGMFYIGYMNCCKGV